MSPEEFQFEDAPAPVKPDYKASREPSAARDFFSNRGRKGGSTPRRKVTVPNVPGQFVEPLQKLYATAGLMLMPFKPLTAMSIAEQAEDCAIAWDNLAQKNETVRGMLSFLVTASVGGALLMAHAPILMSLMREQGSETPMADMMENLLRDKSPANEAE